MNEGTERENWTAEDQQVQSGLTVQEVVGNVLASSGHVARTETFGGDEESSVRCDSCCSLEELKQGFLVIYVRRFLPNSL